MYVEVESAKPAFEPRTLRVTVETAEECESLKALFCRDCFVPDRIASHSGTKAWPRFKHSCLSNCMSKIYQALLKL